MNSLDESKSDDDICDRLIESVVDQSPPAESLDRVIREALSWEVSDSPLEHTQRSNLNKWLKFPLLPLEIAAAVFVMLAVGWIALKPPEDTTETVVAMPGDPLEVLIAKIQDRENSIQRIEFQGTVRTLEKIDTSRLDGESNEAFIERYTNVDLKPTNISVSLKTVRDFQDDVVHVKYGDIAIEMPKYMEYFSDAKQTTQLMGVEANRCQGTIFGGRIAELKIASEMMPRLDLLALRPIFDRPLSLTIMESSRREVLPDPTQRPAFRLAHKRIESDDTFVATFQHLEPEQRNGQKAFGVHWFRVYWKTIGGDLVIHRIDELSVVGDADSMPRGTSLLEDFRRVDGILMPHRIRRFLFGNNFLIATKYDIDEIKLNDQVTVTKELAIPSGTSVRDPRTGARFRVP